MNRHTSPWCRTAVAVLAVVISPHVLATGVGQIIAADFNGDGEDDLAVGVQGEDVNGVNDAGAIHVIFGSNSKLTATGDEFWHLDSAGIPGSPGTGDAFGGALAIGDFDGDGRDDIAVGVSDADISGIDNAGAVGILYGVNGGLSPNGAQLWTQNSPGIADAAEEDDFFGVDLAAGDFNDDGFDDLAIGVSDEDVSGVVNAGAVNVLYGSPAGLSNQGDQFWHQNSPGIADSCETDDFWGFVLAVGDFDGDGFDDLVVTSSDEDVNGQGEAGAVNVMYGSNSGLSASGDQYWHQDSPGIADTAEAADFFGGTLVVGDFDGDGNDDLALGMRLEDIGVIVDCGAVAVLYGSNGGLSASGDRFFHQNSTNVPGNNEAGDLFGTAIAAGDFDDDGRDDLAIGALGEDGMAGSVTILYGTSSGLSASGSERFDQNTSGVADAAEVGDEFGSTLAAGDFNGNGRDDLAIGAPGEDIDGISNAGAVNVLYGTGNGLSASGDQFWHQNVVGIADACEADDAFGGDPLF